MITFIFCLYTGFAHRGNTEDIDSSDEKGTTLHPEESYNVTNNLKSKIHFTLLLNKISITLGYISTYIDYIKNLLGSLDFINIYYKSIIFCHFTKRFSHLVVFGIIFITVPFIQSTFKLRICLKQVHKKYLKTFYS